MQGHRFCVSSGPPLDKLLDPLLKSLTRRCCSKEAVIWIDTITEEANRDDVGGAQEGGRLGNSIITYMSYFHSIYT